jgi:hypothetical protein
MATDVRDFEATLVKRALDLTVGTGGREARVSHVQHPVPKSFFRAVSVADPQTGVMSNTGSGFFLPSLTGTTREARRLPRESLSMPRLPAISIVT